jgi:hypothetical protein
MVCCRQRLGEVAGTEINDKPEFDPFSSVKRKCRRSWRKGGKKW